MVAHLETNGRIKEAVYLTSPKAEVYREIIRFFYLEYNSMNHWITGEEVVTVLKARENFKEYTLEECQQDLNNLVAHKNLEAKQEDRYVTSLKQYLKRSFSYTLTDITRKLEETIIELESINLEDRTGVNRRLIRNFPKLLEEVLIVSKYDVNVKKELDEVGAWWENLVDNFQKLNERYKNTIRLFRGLTDEENLTVQSYLYYKERLMDELGTFINDLQITGDTIEKFFKELSPEVEKDALNAVTTYYERKQLTQEVILREEIYKDILGKWGNIKGWFVGSSQKINERRKVEEKAVEIIRKVIYFANKLSESRDSIASREEEYKKVAKLFNNLEEIGDMHKLSAYIFGIPNKLHIKTMGQRNTSNTDLSVYAEEPYQISLKLRIRGVNQSSKRGVLRDKTKEKKAIIEKAIKDRIKLEKLMKSYIVGNEINFKDLPAVEGDVLNKLMEWVFIGNIALKSKGNSAVKNEYGQSYEIIHPQNGERCQVVSDQGVLDTLAYKIKFKEG